jgi:hypothetical protein
LILCDLLNLTLPFELQASGGGGGGLVAPALSHSSSTRTAIGLAWTAATGATGAVVYDLYRDGELYAAGVSSPYSATADLGQLTVYVWTVVATDDAGSVTSNGVEAALEFDGSAGGGGGAGAGVWLRQATRDLAPIPQASGPTDVWSILDRDGAAVDLTGRTIRFVVGKVDRRRRRRRPDRRRARRGIPVPERRRRQRERRRRHRQQPSHRAPPAGPHRDGRRLPVLAVGRDDVRPGGRAGARLVHRPPRREVDDVTHP